MLRWGGSRHGSPMPFPEMTYTRESFGNNPNRTWIIRPTGKPVWVSVDYWFFDLPLEHLADGPHRWNVYGYVYVGKVSLKDIDEDDLPLHCGCTLKEVVMTQDLLYEDGFTSRVLKIGSDYNHITDRYFTRCDPSSGIPDEVADDALKLLNSLLELLLIFPVL